MTLKILSANPILDGRYLAVKSQTQPKDGGPGQLQMAILKGDGLKLHKKFTGSTAVQDFKRESIVLKRKIEDEQQGGVDKEIDDMFGDVSPNPGQEASAAALAKTGKGKK